MRKTITINGTEYKFKSSAAIPRIYRLKFGRDIFVDMQKIEKQIKIQEKLKDLSLIHISEPTRPY